MKNMVFLEKKEVTDVINFGFSKLDEGKLISPVKNLFILKILSTRRKI